MRGQSPIPGTVKVPGTGAAGCQAPTGLRLRELLGGWAEIQATIL
jgi:hypothetical protein